MKALPYLIQVVAGIGIILLGITFILLTFGAQGLGPETALVFLAAAVAIIFLGSMNLRLVYGHVGRWTIRANAGGLICFAAAAYLTPGWSTRVGLLLFALALVCSFIVSAYNDRSRVDPFSLNAEKGR